MTAHPETMVGGGISPTEGPTRFGDLLLEWAQRTPYAPAWDAGGSPGTYRELAELVSRASRALMGLGVRRGDRVVMQSTPRLEFWVTFLAVANIGAVWVGLDPKFRIGEMREVIARTEPSVVIGLDSFEGRDYTRDLETIMGDTRNHGRLVTFGAQEQQWLSFLSGSFSVPEERLTASRAEVQPTDPLMIVFTSGTTGHPKGAVISHRGLLFSARQAWPTRKPEQAFGTVMNLPINHVGAFCLICAPALDAGGLLVFHDRFDPARVIEDVDRLHLSYLGNVPTAFKLIAAHESWDEAKFSSMQRIVFGGGSMSVDDLGPFLKTNAVIAGTYGLTEASGTVTMVEDGASPDVLSGSIGRLVAGAEARLGKVDGDEGSATDEVGELCVRHPGVFLGYLDDPDATAEALTCDGFLRTGDLASVDSAGNFRLRGRIGAMFKSGGYNIYPDEVVAVLHEHPSILLAAVVPVAHTLFGAVGVAYLQLREGTLLSGPQLDLWCRSRLANYKVPKRFRVLDAMPLLSVGKVDRVAVKKLAEVEFRGGIGTGRTDLGDRQSG